VGKELLLLRKEGRTDVVTTTGGRTAIGKKDRKEGSFLYVTRKGVMTAVGNKDMREDRFFL
jgi:hypothetical protein